MTTNSNDYRHALEHISFTDNAKQHMANSIAQSVASSDAATAQSNLMHATQAAHRPPSRKNSRSHCRCNGSPRYRHWRRWHGYGNRRPAASF